MSGLNLIQSANVLQYLDDAAILLDMNHRVLYWNPGAESLYGIPADKALGRPVEELVEIISESPSRKSVRKSLEEKGHWRGHALHQPKGGEAIWVDWSVSSCELENGQNGFLAITRDISEHKALDERTEHLNAVLRAIRNVNQLITKENDPEELIRKACECLTETLGYFNAWIVRFDENKRFLGASESGLGDDFAPLSEKLLKGHFTKCARRVINGDRMVVVDDPHAECNDCPLSDRYEGRSAYSAGLQRDGKLSGLLSVSVPSQYAEDEEEKALFQEVADDLSFALYRLEMEAKKQESEKQRRLFSEIVANAINPMSFIDSNYIYRAVNPAYSKIYGRDTHAIMGQSVPEMMGKEAFEGVIKSRLDRCLDGEIIQYEEWFDFETLGRRFMAMQYIPFRNDKGRVVGILSYANDITETIKEREAKRKSEQRLKALFDYSPTLVSEVTLDGRYLNVNTTVAKLFGTTPSALTNVRFDKLLDEDTAILFKSRIEEVEKRKAPMTVEDSLDMAGERKTFSTVLFPLFNENGEVESIGSIANDITQDKKADERIEKALDEANSRTHELESLLESAKLVLEQNDFPTTARKIFDAAREMTGAQSGYVALLSDDGEENEVLFLEAGGMPCSVNPDLPMPVRGLRAEAYHSGEVAFDNDFMNSKWADFMPEGHVDLRNVMFSPLNVEGKTLGIMGLANKDGDFTEDNRRMASAFGQLAAMALQNSRYFDALKESEERFRVVMEKLPVGLFAHNLDGRFVLVNDTACRYTGYSRDELLTMAVKDIDSYSIDRNDREKLWLNLARGESLSIKSIHQRKDASHYPAEIRISAIELAGERIMLAIAFDVSEQHKTREALRDSEVLFQNMLNAIPDMVSVHDREMNIVYSNWNGFAAVPEEMRIPRTKCYKTYRGYDEICPDCQAKAVMQDNKPYQSEVRLPDGRWMDLRVIPILDKDEQCTLFVEWVRDISERKKLSDQLQQSQKMESVGRLAGGVAHDFNNLLTGITGNVSLAMMDLSQGDPLLETLDEINQAADSATNLTRQLLAFSRKQIIEPKVLDLNAMIDTMQKMLQRLIGEDVNLLVSASKDIGFIKADQGQLEQILVNLAVNARDAMPYGGKLTIETSNITLDDSYCEKHAQANPGNYVMLAVSDNGAGMDSETQKKVFEPFFTTKAKGEGTGLGLSTVYGIVKQHGGSIEIYSEPGEGTTFKVYFPEVKEKADTPVKKRIVDDLPKGKETILVVEDEHMVRNIAIKILKRQGYKVHHADSGGDALAKVEDEGFHVDLLMTDIVMPNMNGRQLAEKLQKQFGKMKVLYTSGYTENVIAHHGVLDEGVDFIGKPYTPQALAKKVREVLDE